MERSLWCALAVVLCLNAVVAASAAEVYLYDKQWGGFGTADGQFKGNIGLYLRGNRVYTAECDGARVQIFDLDGAYLGKFGTYGSGSGEFEAPRDLVFDALQQYYVVDSELDHFTIFNSVYLPLSSRGGSGTAGDKFDAPWRIALNDSDAMLYVVDLLNNRICQWSTAGAFQRVIGGPGSSDGEFSSPNGVAVDSATGDLYVADTGNHRIQVFSGTGVYKRQFTVGPAASPGSPSAIAVLSGGYVAVGDAGYACVRKLTTSGTPVMQFGAYGTGDGRFKSVDDIAVDASGRLFISDGQAGCNRVQRFVHNYVPSAVAAVSVAPKPPHDSDKLSAKITAGTDGDGDALTYRYQWYYSANNTSWDKSKASRLLPATYTTAGQYWRVKVRAYDGTSFGPWKTSATVRIVADTAPALTLTAGAVGRACCLVSLSVPAAVSGTVVNLAGRPVAELASRPLPAGQSTLALPALGHGGVRLPGGSYLLRLSASGADGQVARQVLPLNLR